MCQLCASSRAHIAAWEQNRVEQVLYWHGSQRRWAMILLSAWALIWLSVATALVAKDVWGRTLFYGAVMGFQAHLCITAAQGYFHARSREREWKAMPQMEMSQFGCLDDVARATRADQSPDQN